MNRTKLAVALAGAAVLLVGCASNSAGTPSVDSSTAVSSSAAGSTESSAAAAITSSSADNSSATSDPVSSADSGTGSATGASSSEDSSSSETSRSGTSTAVSTSTAGDQSGQLDAQSTKWFETFCTSVAPFKAQLGEGAKIGGKSGDPAAAKKAVVGLYSGLGDTMTAAANSVKDLPPPTFSGGEAFAKKVITTFGELGPKFTALSKKIQSEDPSKLSSSVSSLGTDLSAATGAVKLTPETEAAVNKIPACAKLSSG